VSATAKKGLFILRPEVVVDKGGAELGVLDGGVEERLGRKKGEVEENSESAKKLILPVNDIILVKI
jgi:hypothetical protein